MRADASMNDTKNARSGRRPVLRNPQLRRGHLRALALEKLEERTLLSTLPSVTVNGLPTTISSDATGSENSPTIVVDPNAPQKMVAIWTDNDPTAFLGLPAVYSDAAYSTDGGKTWTDMLGPGIRSATSSPISPRATVPPPDFPAVTDPSVSFDAHDNFYITSSAHEADQSAGQITMDSFSFLGTAPIQKITDQPVTLNDVAIGAAGPLEWAGGKDGAIYGPSVTADANQYSVTTPPGTGGNYTQTDPGAGSSYSLSTPGQGNVYLTFNTATDLSIGETSTAYLLASNDGGNTFYALKVLSNGEIANAPKSVVSQGRPAGVNGAGVSVPAVPGGRSPPSSTTPARSRPPARRSTGSLTTSFGSAATTSRPARP